MTESRRYFWSTTMPRFAKRWPVALAARGFDVRIALTGEEADRLIEESVPEYAIIDLKLPDGYGLKLISALMALDRSIRIVVLTGYGSISTAVEAIKLGATYYLAKPANVDEIVNAFHRDAGNDNVPLNGKTMSLSRAGVGIYSAGTAAAPRQRRCDRARTFHASPDVAAQDRQAPRPELTAAHVGRRVATFSDIAANGAAVDTD